MEQNVVPREGLERKRKKREKRERDGRVAHSGFLSSCVHQESVF